MSQSFAREMQFRLQTRKTIGVDIVGFGPIGRNLAERLVVEEELGKTFRVNSISDSSATIFPDTPWKVIDTIKWKSAGLGRKLAELSGSKRSKNLPEVIGDNSKSSIVIDVTSSDYSKHEEAKKRALTTLNAGKYFVSANKVALSHYFSELFELAKNKGVEIGFGATICGGRHAISVARNIESSEIISALAVLNASTTFILSKLEEDRTISFDEACNEAAETGILESDWSIDLDSIDAAAKTAILANVLYPDSKATIGKVARTGIRDERAQEMITSLRATNSLQEKRIRLVSEITREKTSVEPMLLPKDSPLAVKGRFNVVCLNTLNLGEISVRNLGGGVALTSSVIISDLKQIAGKMQG